MTMSWDADQNAISNAMAAMRPTSEDVPAPASPRIDAIRKSWQITIQERRRPNVPRRGA